MPDETTSTAVADAPSGDLSGFAAMGLDPGSGISDSAPTKPAPAAEPKAPAQPAPGPAPAPQPQRPRREQLEAVKDPKLRGLLTNMSNDAFAHFYDLALKMQAGEYIPKSDYEKALKEREEAAAAQVTSARYLDHEKGYMLTPEYEEVAGAMETASQRLSFWEEQAGAFAAGQPFRILERTKDGQWVPSQHQYDPKQNPTAAGGLQSNIARAHSELLRLQERLESMPKSHKESYSKHRASIDELNTSLFGKAENAAFKARAKEYLESFPKALQADNQIVLIANLRAAGDLLMAEIERLRGDLGKSQNRAKAITQGAPDPAITNGISAGGTHDDKSAVEAIDKLVRGRR